MKIPFDTLKKPSEFKIIYKKGIKFFTGCFSVHFLPPSQTDNQQIEYGITISKKICKRANKRNKIKRRIRESFRLYALDENLLGYKIIFTAFKKSNDKIWDDYVRAMRHIPRLVKEYTENPPKIS